MDDLDQAAARLEALGNPTRLAIYRLLVRAGEQGRPVGHIQAALKVAASTLSHHLKHLEMAGLVIRRKQGVTHHCSANYATMDDLIAYLNEADGTPIELAAAAPANDDAENPAADEPKPEDVAKPADAPKADDGDKDETKSEGDAKPNDVEKAEDGDAKPADNAANAEGDNTAVAAADANNDNAPAAGGETAAAFAGGDAKAGEKVFRKCKACHKVEDGKKGVGPHLWGVINRDIASVDGFKYSQVMQDLPGNWTATELAKFLADPKGYAKGTKMAFAGLKKEQDIVNLITYLNEADGTPDPLQ